VQLRFAVVIAGAALAGVAGNAVAASTSVGEICGQIRNGPYDAWTVQAQNGPLRLKGRTWTVAVFPGTSCSKAMKATPGLLKQWAKAKPGQPLKPPAGFAGCGKVENAGPKNRVESSGGQCYDAAGSGFRFLMTGKLTKTQIQALP
jgi:hypothetical protein